MVSMRLQKLVCRIGLYVPFMLCMTGLAAAFLPGCRKDESAVSVAPAPSDPLTATLVTRDGLAERLHAILEKAQDRLPGADEATLKAELEKDAEWVRLKKEFDEMSKTIDKLRKNKCGEAGQVQGKISK